MSAFNPTFSANAPKERKPAHPAYLESQITRRQDYPEPPKVIRTKTGVRFNLAGIRFDMRTDAATALQDALTAALNPAEVQS